MRLYNQTTFIEIIGRDGKICACGKTTDMATQQQKATIKLRELILSGKFGPGDWLREQTVSEQLGTSRTPARIAMQILEQEGLLQFHPNRGFCVEKFTLQQISDAVDLRGLLEGLACQLVARSGLPKQVKDELNSCVARGQEIIERGSFETEDAGIWAELNHEFHQKIVDASNNETLIATLAFNNRIPLASAGAIFFFSQRADLAIPMLRDAQRDHEEILNAISARDSGRAEHLMREHARRSRNNKILFLRDIRTSQFFENIPGSKLVVS